MQRSPVRLKARIEKVWVLSISGVEIPIKFEKKQEMADLALLEDSRGQQIVVDIPNKIEEVIGDLLGQDEGFEVRLVKASKSIQDAIREAMDKASEKVAQAEQEDKPRGEPQGKAPRKDEGDGERTDGHTRRQTEEGGEQDGR